MSLRWLVTGAAGMLGSDVTIALQKRDDEVIALPRSELDISDRKGLTEKIDSVHPDIIVNCAAYTRVDDAESDEAAATAVNGAAVMALADAANQCGALLTQVSTDFVFDGSSQQPYDTDDTPAPLSAYGRSKLLGERAASNARSCLIVRAAWLFGVRGPNFVEAIRNQVRKGTNPLRVVDDQRGRPTYTPHLAAAIIELSLLARQTADARGIVHYGDRDECTWFDFAREIVRLTGSATTVRPVTTAEFVRPAPRPAYSVLSTRRYERLTGLQPQSWRDGLREYFALRP